MAKLCELTGPVMRSSTCLQRYRATRRDCEENQQLSPADPLAKYRSTPLIRSMSSRLLRLICSASRCPVIKVLSRIHLDVCRCRTSLTAEVGEWQF